MHDILLEMLVDIDNAISSRNIPIYIVGGTSIGLKRNGSFIPWDDDVDIVFDEKYSNDIENVLKSELSEKYIIESPNTVENHKSFFRVIKRNTCLIRNPNEKNSQGVSIELFPMVHVPDQGIKRKLYFGAMHCYIVLNNAGNYVPSFLRVFVLGAKKATKMFLDKMSTTSECTCVSSINGMFFHDIVPESLFGTPTYYSLSGKMLPFPEHLEDYLTYVYGDYMTPPPEEKRNPTFIVLDLENGWECHMDEARKIYRSSK